MPLDEFLIVFFGLFVVLFVEFGPKILLDRLSILSWAGFPSSTASPPLPCPLQYPGWDQALTIQCDIDARKNNTLVRQ